MLVVDKISAGYGKFQVLFDVSLEAKEKEITVIIGPNGAGKTTLLKTIVGFTNVYSGKINFMGNDITSIPPHKRVKLGLALLPQFTNIFANLTVRENLVMAGYDLKGDEMKEKLDQVLDIFPVLKNFLQRKAGTLSGGERQMLAMSMLLMRKPKLVLLDEPTTGLSPKMVSVVLSKSAELRDKLGITVVLVEQNAKKALEIGDKAYILVSGRKVHEDDAKDLLKNPELSKMYFGVE